MKLMERLQSKEKIPSKNTSKKSITLNKHWNNSQINQIFNIFRHRTYSFIKTSFDETKTNKLIEKIENKGKTIKKKTSNLNFSVKNQKEDVFFYNLNASSPKNKPKFNSNKENVRNISIINTTTNKKRYIINGGFEALKKALEKRGFTEEKDETSKNFNFKFVLLTKSANIETLQAHQYVNHYRRNTALSRKVELMRNLRGLIYKGIDIDTFYPRCYDLGEKVDIEDFLDDYKMTKSVSYLKSFVFNQCRQVNEESNVSIMNLRQVIVSFNILKHRLEIIKSHLNTDDPYKSINQAKSMGSIHESDWEVLLEDEDKEGKSIKKEINKLKMTNKLSNSYGKPVKLINEVLFKESKISKDDLLQAINTTNTVTNHQFNEIMTNSQDLLVELQELYPQFSIDGNENIWIMKPSGLSRGRGISCIKSILPVLKTIKNNSQYVIQKYIENPLLLKNRKFDIRQWVLITSISPLVIWKYEDFYLRFSAKDYSTKEISNNFIHLTNNSITKHCETTEEHMKFEGNMCSREEFISILNNLYGRDVYSQVLESKINKILVWTMQCAKEKIEHRTNSFEIFGFDLMVDEKLNVWLIEVNSSPAMDYSTKVTEKVVKEGLEDLVKVVVDRKVDGEREVDTGRFVLIYSGEEFESKVENMVIN